MPDNKIKRRRNKQQEKKKKTENNNNKKQQKTTATAQWQIPVPYGSKLDKLPTNTIFRLLNDSHTKQPLNENYRRIY